MILSLVARVKRDTLGWWINLKDPLAVFLVRYMPNMPSTVNYNVLGLYIKSFGAELAQSICVEKESSKLRLTSMDTRKLATVTAYGVDRLVLEKIKKDNNEQVTLKELRRKVINPNSTTHATIKNSKNRISKL